MNRMNVWGRILRGQDKVLTRRFIQMTRAKYSSSTFFADQYSMYQGYCGYSLLESYSKKKISNFPEERALEKVPALFHLPAAYWCHHHLHLNDTVCRIHFSDFLKVLPEQIKRLEITDGLIGIGTLAYIATMSGKKGKSNLISGINRLLQIAERTEDSIYWKADPRYIRINAQLTPKEEKEKYLVDLGIAHGQAGVISFLSWIILGSFIKDKKKTSELKTIIREALQVYPISDNVSPAFLVGKKERTHHFPGWCYGNIGMGFSHLLAGIALNDEVIKNQGIEMIKKFASDDAMKSNQVNSFLCHGTSGVAQVLARGSELTGSKELFELTREWFSLTLKKCLSEEPTSDFGLMNSPVGTALALLSAIEPLSPSWDRFMLLSNPYD